MAEQQQTSVPQGRPNGWSRFAPLLFGLVLGLASGVAGGLLTAYVNEAKIEANTKSIERVEMEVKKLIERHEDRYHSGAGR